MPIRILHHPAASVEKFVNIDAGKFFGGRHYLVNFTPQQAIEGR